MCNHLLETLGRGLAVDTAGLLIRWLNDYGYTLLRDGSESRTWLEEAVEDLLRGRPGSAEQRAQACLTADPECTAAHMVLGAAHLAENRVGRAAEALQTVCRRRPDQTLALYVLGHCCERLTDESRAVACYQDSLKLRGFLRLPCLRLGAIHVKNLQYDSALDQYLALRRIDPEVMAVHTGIGHLYTATGQYTKAIEAFQNAILMDPDALAWKDPEIDLLIQTQHLDEARTALEDSLEQFPAKPDLLARHADVLSLLDDKDQAAEEYREALEACPNFLEVALKLAAHLERQEAYREAAEYYNQSLEITEQVMNAYIGLARSHQLAGDTPNALAALCSASMLLPNASLLLVQTARMLMDHAHSSPWDEATSDPHAVPRLLHQALRARLGRYPNDPTTLYTGAALASYAQDHASALNQIRAAAQLHPDSPPFHNALILRTYALGDNAQAIRALTANAPGQSPIDLYYKTAVLYCSREHFAGSMLNLDRHLAEGLAQTDPVAHVRVILQDVGLLDRGQLMLEWLEETLAACSLG